MSYCRFEGRKSNVYAYAGRGGYTTVLAGGKIQFSDRTRRDFYNRLCKLKAAGITVPAAAFKRLRTELGLSGGVLDAHSN